MIRTVRNEKAFSLVEISIVLLIVGVLARSLIEPLSGARQLNNRKATTSQLEAVRTSLLAHVVAHGVLPCPIELTESSTSQRRAVGSVLTQAGQLPDAGSPCRISNGGIPAAELGLAGAINAQGALLDVWNRPYYYALSLHSHAERGDQQLPDWTSEGEASRIGLPEMRADLLLCSVASRARCPGRKVRAHGAVFVVLSLGEDASLAGAQFENQDNDLDYLLQTESKNPDTLYDDQLVWATAPDILYWMLRAGWLP